MSDFHAAWANENVRAAREFTVDGVPLEPGQRWSWPDPLPQPTNGPWHVDGTWLEPSEPPKGQDVSQDRQDTVETSADTNPCKSDCP